MNLLIRAFLYVTRKWGKSLLLFSIIFVISTLVLCGLASLDAEEKTSVELRGTTGASFTVSRNLSTGGWGSGKGGSYSTQEFITDEMVKKIATVEGIEAYNATYATIFEFFDTDGHDYEHINPIGQSMVDDQYYSIGTMHSEYSSMFLSHAFTLVEGRHITNSDHNVLLISKAIADKHKLHLGDPIVAVNDLSEEFTIIGIFDVVSDKTDEKNSYNMASYYDYENYAFMDIKAMANVLKNFPDGPSEGYSSADFFVTDPTQLETIIMEVHKKDSINWNNFTVSANNEVYERTAHSMSDMSSLIRALIIVIVGISMGIVTLILTMWVKSRIRETGILLAAGISKRSILLQQISEVGFIAIFGFSLSYWFSKGVAGNVGSLFGMTTDRVIVTSRHFGFVSSLGAVILILSILISSISTMRVKPKEILSKMS
ncbi:ABC transporter permease [Gorillibacterium timonense]|uniref:ABC transporter permease n=1 Tax=Gorillibacterium timonense TaxID=1689269 RepID=UPI00071DD5FF|nr:FtsX-like permease family protein [Gorillibacterium timonense]